MTGSGFKVFTAEVIAGELQGNKELATAAFNAGVNLRGANTDPKVAREAIKNEFMKIKTFKGIQSYVMRDTGDMHIPGRALVADTTKNEWRFADK